MLAGVALLFSLLAGPTQSRAQESRSVEAAEEELAPDRGSGPKAVDDEIAQELGTVPEPTSADQLAKELANPNAPVMALRNLLDITTYRGSAPGAERWSFTYTFQASLPFAFEAGNLIFRPTVPVLFGQPFVDGNGSVDQAVAFGNIGLDSAFGKTFDNGLLLIGGLNVVFPTSSRSELRADWTLGPELAVGYVGNRGLLGALTGFVWNLPATDRGQAVVGQYFYALSIAKGWQFAAQPTWNYQRATNQLTFPIGLGVQKVAVVGKRKQLMQFGAQIWAYAAQSDVLGPIWQLRFSVAPIVPVPWEK